MTLKKLHFLIFAMLLLVFIGTGCSNDEGKNKTQKDGDQVELTVSAAVSLQDALSDIKTAFEKDYPNVKVNFNLGASGALQQQISQGAPVDLFFSAAEDKFEKLVDEDLIDEKNKINLVGNQLVLVVPKDSDKDLRSIAELTKADKVSIGTPESVPAGQYAKQTLENSNLWKEIEDKVVYSKDVRQVLTYVESGNVDAGLVYKTDALSSSKVKLVATAKENLHDPIIYPVGIIKESSHQKEAQQFYDYLQTPASMKIFIKSGFEDLNNKE